MLRKIFVDVSSKKCNLHSGSSLDHLSGRLDLYRMLRELVVNLDLLDVLLNFMRLYLVHLVSNHLVILIDEIRTEIGIRRRAPRRCRIDQVFRFGQFLVVIEEVFQVQKLDVLRLLDYARQTVLCRDGDPEIELRGGGQRSVAIVHFVHL